MSILNLSTDLLPFLELSADDSYSNVARVQAGVEQLVKSYCGRDFESGTYKEEIVRNDGYSIFVRNPPITKITKLAIGTVDALRIYNTNTATSAIVNVSATEVVLTYNGSDDSADLTFATNTTIGALATAINAVGSGWVAVAESDYSSYKSTELLPRYGAEAIDSTNVYLKVPAQTLTDYEVNPNTGEIYRSAGFYMDKVRSRAGLLDSDYAFRRRDEFYPDDFNLTQSQKIYVHYTGGYSTIPADLKMAIMQMVKFEYQKIEEETIGVKNISIGGLSKGLEEFPASVKRVLDSYKMWGM